MHTIDAARLFMESRRQRLLSQDTLSLYEWALAKLTDAFPDDLPSDRSEIQLIIDRNGDLSLASLRTIWDRLRTFWTWLCAQGLCEANPMLDMPSPLRRRKLPRVLTDCEIQMLLGVTTNERNRAMLITLLDTGLRVGELVSLRRNGVRPDGLTVSGKVGERTVPVSPAVYRLLCRQGNEKFVWLGLNGRLSRWGCQQAVRSSMEAAGLLPPKLGPHTLRHTFGVQYLVNGGDAGSLQRILGHRKLDTTMLYMEMSNQMVVTQHHKFSPMRDLADTD